MQGTPTNCGPHSRYVPDTADAYTHRTYYIGLVDASLNILTCAPLLWWLLFRLGRYGERIVVQRAARSRDAMARSWA